MLGNLILDIALTGAALCVFALFHHVLPRALQSEGIVITQAGDETQTTAAPNQTQAAQEEKAPAADAEETATSAPEAAAPSGKTWKQAGRSRSVSQKGANASGQKGGSALNALSDAEEESADTDVSPAQKFADQFSDEVVRKDSSYKSPTVSITVSKETLLDEQITYYLADIYLADATSFKTALAGDTYGTGYRDSILDMALQNSALLAVNGDYYGNTAEGVVIRNGVLYRANSTDCDVCVLYRDGTMRVMRGDAFSVDEAIADGAWQAWTFGPALLDAEGNAIESFSSTARIISANPRTAIGYYEPGHYCLLVVDGRGTSAGITLPRMSALFEALGCKAAYNLDGGNSSIMVWQDAVLNQPSGGGRESSDCLLIEEASGHADL